MTPIRKWTASSSTAEIPIPKGEEPMISLKHLAKVYRTDEVETTALRDMNLDVAPGEFVAVMGPSGCGKSTFLNIVGVRGAPSAGGCGGGGGGGAGGGGARRAGGRGGAGGGGGQ